ERIRAGAASDLKAGHSRLLDELFPCFVHDAVDRRAPQFPPTAERPFWEMPVFASREVTPANRPTNRADLRSLARLPEHEDAALAPPDFAIVLFDDGVALSAFLTMNEEGAPARMHVVPVRESEGLRSGRRASEKRVAIVGCGSVGSKVAEFILRSGV